MSTSAAILQWDGPGWQGPADGDETWRSTGNHGRYEINRTARGWYNLWRNNEYVGCVRTLPRAQQRAQHIEYDRAAQARARALKENVK